ncbi:MAG TPA: hypothetical protein VLT33_35615, partial [Labilithrix sp.]|nr:hypothetical protein [Labilithrix sp.]
MKAGVFHTVLGLGALALGSACSMPGGGDQGSPASDGSGNRDGTGPGGAPGTSEPGPGGRGGGGGFMVTGHVAQAPSWGGGLRPMDGTGPAAASRVTHVMGVTPSSQNTRRVVAKVDAQGKFALDLDPSRLWVLVFVDASKVGSEMVVGVFRAKGLDTMAPTKKGSTDLGEVTAKDGAAEVSLPYEDLLSALGIDAASALFLSSIDDMCLRVVNPDVDGDGTIDALEPGPADYRLDFHVQFAMRTDHVVSVSDMVDAFLPDTVTLTYRGTGIYTSFMRAAFPPGWEGSRWASFDQELHYAPEGGMGPGAPRVAAAGASIAAE